jgi:hypothetical protein
MEQEEYNHEAINWQHIEFVDNQEALDLIAVRYLTLANLTLIKKKRQFSSYIRKSRCERLQSHIWGRAALYIMNAQIFNHI